MAKIAIVTDSNSGITQAEGKQLGVYVLPMPFDIDGQQYFEDINLTQEQFYEKLTGDADVSTSQPSPDAVMSLWDDLLKNKGYDEIVHIPMSSGLSSSCATAMMLAQDYDGKVQVVDNQRISVTMRQSVLDAKELAKRGKSAAEIKEILEKHKMESSIYITLETLKYLKKGGRITPAAAAIGTMLKLNPVLQIQGEKLDAFAKARGKASAKKIMLKAMQDDLDTRFAEFAKDGKMHMEVAYSGNPEEAEEWAALVKETFPQFDFHMDPLSLSVACHIGHGALAIATSAYLPELD
jgi:DegV family protein with EDD domain